ncbi:hypothetical protein ABGF48_02925 [Helcococcus bovis]|uniref:hypothetical protein n=1 Tax=Helcococcus bovis TaxID=3153252 RepID=UPI0038BAA0E4
MILIIFNKIIKNHKGGVQFIESAIVFPALLLFLSILFIISIKTFSAGLIVEKSYVESRELLYKTSNEFEIVKRINKEDISKTEINLQNFSKKFTTDEIKLNINENIFNNSIAVYKKDDKFLSTKKIYPSDIMRKFDFTKEVLNDIKDVKFRKYTLSGVFDSISGLADNIKNKIKK